MNLTTSLDSQPNTSRSVRIKRREIALHSTSAQVTYLFDDCSDEAIVVTELPSEERMDRVGRETHANHFNDRHRS
jgi:hypothetical protein